MEPSRTAPLPLNLWTATLPAGESRLAGWLAEPGDAKAWAAAMARAIDVGPLRRREMGETGMNRARQL